LAILGCSKPSLAFSNERFSGVLGGKRESRATGSSLGTVVGLKLL
jgi:hypothetical protein